MKKMKYVLNGFLALALALMFTQCTDKKAENGNSTEITATVPGSMKN